ncbi:hypothetical protein VM_03470 [Vibrio mimicus]|nr:hypothetical protein VM_03470 [Vibrio mimicus]
MQQANVSLVYSFELKIDMGNTDVTALYMQWDRHFRYPICKKQWLTLTSQPSDVVSYRLTTEVIQ